MSSTTFLRTYAAALVVVGVFASVIPAPAGFPLSNDPTPLAVCQDSLRTASLRLATDARRALGACFTRGIECVAGSVETRDACCGRAEERCRRHLATIDKALARFGAYVGNRRCAVVPFADVVGGTGLGYSALEAVCAALDPPAVVSDLDGLTDCLGRIVVRDTTCLVGSRELPRSAEAVACAGLESALRATTGADLATCAVPPEATATPSASATPTPGATASRTATPTAAATVSRTPTPTSAATSSVQATATSTSGPGATVTPTSGVMATSTPTRTPTTTPTPSGPACGNGTVEAGEDCDDGNTSNCDACPRDCRTSTAPAACSATTVRHAQRIRLRAPQGAVLSGGLFCLDYPAGVVALPGTGPVSGRSSGVSGLVTLNDFNNAVQLGFVTNPGAAELTPTISFDLCSGAAAPVPAAFVCEPKSASNQGVPIDLALVECTPVTP